MRNTENEDRARQAVTAELAAREKSPVWLVRTARIDAGTLADFLGGQRWPKTSTQGKIERALNWEPGTINAIAMGGEVPRRQDDETADDELNDLIRELRDATPEKRKLLRDLLASWRQTG